MDLAHGHQWVAVDGLLDQEFMSMLDGGSSCMAQTTIKREWILGLARYKLHTLPAVTKAQVVGSCRYSTMAISAFWGLQLLRGRTALINA